MSISLNAPSEATTQFNNHHSSIFNSSNIDNISASSYLSPRHESVTLLAKKIFSKSCVSPYSEKLNFPVSPQVVNRLKKQAVQAKKIMKKKRLKELKSKYIEHNSLSKVPAELNSLPKLRQKKNLKKNKKKPEKKLKSPDRVKKAPQKTTNKLGKKKNDEASLLNKLKENLKKILVDERNEKIKLENSGKIKKVKKKGKQNDLKKQINNEKEDDSKEVRKITRCSPDYLKKAQFNLPDPFISKKKIKDRRSNSVIARIETSPNVKNSPNSALKSSMKNKKKQDREKKKKLAAEDLKKEARRFRALKQIEIRPKNCEKNKSQSSGRSKDATKLSEKLEVLEGSCFKSTNSQLGFKKVKMASPRFTEESARDLSYHIFKKTRKIERLKNNKIESRETLKKIDSKQENRKIPKKLTENEAALKIQKFYRKFVKGKKRFFEASVVINFSDSASEEVVQFLAEPLSPKSGNLNFQDPKSDPVLLTRYHHIADFLQTSLSEESFSNKLDQSSSIRSYKKELENIEKDELDFSFPSYKSGKSQESFQENKQVKTTPLPDFQESQKSGFEAAENQNLDSRNPTSGDRKESPKDQVIIKIKPEEIALISEDVLRTVLEEMVEFSKTREVVDKNPSNFIDQLVYSVPEAQFKKRLSKPLKKDPLTILKIMHIDDCGYPEEFYTSQGHPVLDNSLFSKVSSSRTINIKNEQIKIYQTLNDQLVFDTCNEVLNSFRLFGTLGKPMPWDWQALKFSQNFSLFSVMPAVLRKVEKIYYLDNGESSRDYEGQKKYLECKVKTLLNIDIRETEEVWLNYAFEEAQAKINTAEILLQVLIDETIRIFRE